MNKYRKVGARAQDKRLWKREDDSPASGGECVPCDEWSQHCVLTKHDSGGVRCAVLFQNFLFEIILFNLATEAK